MNLVLDEIRKKNEKVFKNFFDKNYKDLVIYANGFLYCKDASEDVVQEVFIYLWENASSLDIKTSLKNYLYSMVRNRCFNYLKSIKIADSYKVLDFNNTLFSEQVLDKASEEEKKIVYKQILKIVDSLPDKMQQIVKLKFFQNYKYSEIATEMGVSVNTVKTQLKRAKLKISEMLTIILVLFEING
ncbi:RNA polymerase sigma-70 factor [Tamlana crocina]